MKWTQDPGERAYADIDIERWEDELVALGFTRREAQVIVRLRQGMTEGEIAEDLGLSAGEVETHRATGEELAGIGLRRYLLLYGPSEFHANTDEYPELKRNLEKGLNLDN